MSLTGIIGTKIDQTQAFLEDGTRVPVTKVLVKDVVVTQVKSADRDGYHAVQLATGTKKRANRSLQGHLKKAGVTTIPRFFSEIRTADAVEVTAGTTVVAADIFKPGDFVNVTGVSKGKGFAGAVKRHHFRGGPRTHGQSDRERAPGSIGQTTTPGRVYKGKRMAGHMGAATATVEFVEVVDIDGDTLFIKGPIPGVKGGMVTIQKVGENKKFKPLFKKAVPEVTVTEEVITEEAAVEAAQDQENSVKEEPKTEAEEVKVAEAAPAVESEAENPAEPTKDEVEKKEEEAEK